jgi:hypothetical protein
MADGVDGVIDWLLQDGRRIAEGTVVVTELAAQCAADSAA